MKRKCFAVLLCGLLILTLCAGCRKDDQGEANTPPADQGDGTGGTAGGNGTTGNGTTGGMEGSGGAGGTGGAAGTGTPADDTAVPPSLGTAGELTADKLADLLGGTETDLSTAMGEDAVTDDASGARTYKTSMYGKDAEVRFTSGDDGSVENVLVTVAQDVSDAWNDALMELFGADTDGLRTRDGVQVRTGTDGDKVTYTFSKAAAE